MRLLKSKLLRSAGVAAAPLLFLVLAGCSSSQSVLEPATGPTKEIASLYAFIFYLAAGIFILVEGLLVYFVIRYQRRRNEEIPEQIHGNTPLEIAWTIAPALVLIAIFVVTARTMASVDLTAPPPGSINVRVIGHQWWWEYQYPDLKIVTANDLHVPVGEVVHVTLESSNVIHSFWIPQISGKMDVVPGHQNRTWFRADQAGEYRGQCAEFCGTQHAHMLFRVIAESRADFDTWAKQQQSTPAPPPEVAVRATEILVKGGCIGCHTIAGTNALGTVGPNLTHFGSRRTIAAGVLENTPENLARWLRDPQAVKPGNDMPRLARTPENPTGVLTEEDIQALVAYLQSLK